MNPWKSVTILQVVMVAGLFLWMAWVRMSSPEHWIRILDDANLIFHEAGHPIFGLFGPTLGLYGGTLGQLVFPAITVMHFWRRGEPVGFSLCLGWFFENFLNIGRYMSDARAQLLPLVGGGEHDWTAIFTRWGVLRYDTTIGGLFMALGWIGICGSSLWLFSRYYIERGEKQSSSK
jgi:hypothetical protein